MDQEKVILVEGESDRVALETLAARLKLDLAGVTLTAMGGVTNVGAHLERLAGSSRRIAVLCDERESPKVQRAAERLGVTILLAVCSADLEDELIRALGVAAVEQVIVAQGELDAFRALQRMPQHRGRTAEQQLRRFIGTKAGRKARFGRAVVEALDLARVPAPLLRALEV